jgi:hypothetical protein
MSKLRRDHHATGRLPYSRNLPGAAIGEARLAVPTTSMGAVLLRVAGQPAEASTGWASGAL